MSEEITSPLADIVRKAMEGKSSGKVQQLREAEQKPMGQENERRRNNEQPKVQRMR